MEGKQITLVHVLAPLEDGYDNAGVRNLPWWKKKVASARAYLSRCATEVRLHGVAAKIEVLMGDKVAEAIADYARSVGADLIAIATHGRGGVARMVRGSVADEVIRSAKCSLLVLHAEKAVETSLFGRLGQGIARERSNSRLIEECEDASLGL